MTLDELKRELLDMNPSRKEMEVLIELIYEMGVAEGINRMAAALKPSGGLRPC